jgi:glycosyltransferase involved in cell wall biosynthesis
MVIYINARFLTQPITGVQRFAIELSLRLKQIDPSIEFVCPKDILHHDIRDKLNAKIIGNKTRFFWEQIDLPLYLKKQGSPLLINFDLAPAYYKNKIVTLHDITRIRYPQSYSLWLRVLWYFLIPTILKRSLSLITVSEFSKREILNYYKYIPSPIHIVHNAIGEGFKTNAEIRDDKCPPYLLTVSSPAYHKNQARMIRAFVNIHASRQINLDLVIIGESFRGMAKKSDDINCSSFIRFGGRIDDDELVRLYQGAEAFIFPSLYEGFGIPPLEAQACGCPVIASNAASMPEVLEDSVLYFNPNNIHEMQKAINTIISDRQLRESLIRKGFSNVSRFSWDISAQKLYQIILQYS